MTDNCIFSIINLETGETRKIEGAGGDLIFRARFNNITGKYEGINAAITFKRPFWGREVPAEKYVIICGEFSLADITVPVYGTGSESYLDAWEKNVEKEKARCEGWA